MNILAEGVTDEDLIYESVAEWDGEPELNRWQLVKHSPLAGIICYNPYQAFILNIFT
jgi:hypothetical protein